ncbi:MAG TPA: helix-turn-helix domain-containing protein [Stellaceae bacterium]|jgi:transcriptional regulator with XRE-family HTH domain|nr:helix-turn-helix domain-containing protein [Stellaceae bacterium]
MKIADQQLASPARPQRQKRRSEHDLYAGERLRLARQLAGISQQQLGHALGVSFQAVQKYETGENRLSAGRLVKAAAFLGVDLAFFAKDHMPPTEETDASPRFTAEEVGLVRAYRALRSEALRTELRRLLAALVAEVPPGAETGAP